MVNQFLMFVAATTDPPPLVTLLQRDGYFYVTQGEKTLANQTHTGDFQSQHPTLRPADAAPGTLQAMATSASDMRGRDMCAGGIQARDVFVAALQSLCSTRFMLSCCRGTARAHALPKKCFPRFQFLPPPLPPLPLQLPAATVVSHPFR